MNSDRHPLADNIRRPLVGARVDLAGVTRTFESRAALLPITLKIEPGDFVSLLGPSGSGKSTLLRLIAGLESADSGVVSVSGGSPLTPISKGFVFQDSALLPWRTVLANVALPLELTGIDRTKAKRLAREALNQVRLGEASELYPNQLSGGMKMRASVARAIVAEPSLLLLDEPFAALDERSRFRLQDDLRDLWLRLKMTTIFVTHSASEAVFVSNRAIVLSQGPGRIVLDHVVGPAERRTRELRTDLQFQREIQILNAAFAEDDQLEVSR